MTILGRIFYFASGVGTAIFASAIFAAMALVMLFCALKISRKSPTVAVVVSGVICALLAIPLYQAIETYAGKKAQDSAKIPVEALLAEQKVRDAKIKSLNEEIELLKSARLSMQQMSRICEVALLETALRQIDVQKEHLNSRKGAGILADTITEESLVIQTHDVNAKFGVDLQKVKVRETDGGLLISGIKSKYIGSDRNITTHILSEIRKVEAKGSAITTTIFNSAADKELARQKEISAEKRFQERLSDGAALGFMDSAVEKLAENFIIAILAPLEKPISFVKDDSDGEPILDFLKAEIDEKTAILTALE